MQRKMIHVWLKLENLVFFKGRYSCLGALVSIEIFLLVLMMFGAKMYGVSYCLLHLSQ